MTFRNMDGKCTLKVYGGLGNQLFQIATAMSYCTEHNKELELVGCDGNRMTYYWDTLLKHFAPLVRPCLPLKCPIYHEIGFSYKPIGSMESDFILDGYFQSSKHFKGSKLLGELLTWPADIKERLLTKYGSSIFDPNVVIVHARRGDYLASEWNKLVHGPLPASYYQLGIETIKNGIEGKPLFVLISDDNSFWSSSELEFLKDENTLIFDENDIDTLYLMTQSLNFIIANSTFSWWGAYLASALNVIAPSKWFGPRGPQDWQDIYETSWTIIPVS